GERVRVRGSERLGRCGAFPLTPTLSPFSRGGGALSKRIPRIFMALAFGAIHFSDPAHAPDFPTKPITIVLVLAPGRGLDIVARAYGEKLAQSLGKPVVFDNRPGANGILAVSALKNMPGDGHALLVGTSGPLAANKITYKHLPYDPEKDLVPVSLYLKS